MDQSISAMADKMGVPTVAPRGRPPVNYRWAAGFGYVNNDTGNRFDRADQEFILRTRKTASERRRYWDPNKNVRARRLLRGAKQKDKPLQLDAWMARSDDQSEKAARKEI
jgi:hypothetical protein